MMNWMKGADKNQRYLMQNSLDLTQYGFERVDEFTYKNDKYFSVVLSDWFVVFSSRQFTRAIDYNKIEAFLKEEGFIKQDTINQESPKSGSK